MDPVLTILGVLLGGVASHLYIQYVLSAERKKLLDALKPLEYSLEERLALLAKTARSFGGLDVEFKAAPGVLPEKIVYFSEALNKEVSVRVVIDEDLLGEIYIRQVGTEMWMPVQLNDQGGVA